MVFVLAMEVFFFHRKRKMSLSFETIYHVLKKKIDYISAVAAAVVSIFFLSLFSKIHFVHATKGEGRKQKIIKMKS